MAKILIVSANLKDWTKNSGGKDRTATLAEALKDHEVIFLSFSWYNEIVNKRINNIQYVQPGLRSGIEKRRRNLINGIAQPNHDIVFELLKDELKSFSQTVKDLSQDVDLIIIDHYSVSPLVNGINNVPIVYNSHNSEISMANQLYPKNKEVIDIVEKMEKEVLKKSNAITYCSKKDLSELESHYGKIFKSAYIPNGAIAQDTVDYKDRLMSRDIIFVGSGHPPNNVAAKSVVRIAKDLPEFNFIIIGSCGNSIKQKPSDDNIKILGEVDDATLHKYFKNSFAFINPMESGSGTHLKMMKALSYGIPIVSSSIGARGFSKNEINQSMLIANDDREIIKNILKLKNKDLYKDLCTGGPIIFKQYDWEVIKKDYANFIESLIDNKSKKTTEPNQKEKILICSVIRNEYEFIDNYYNRLKDIVRSFPEYEFYLSIYENDSSDGTMQRIMNKDYSMFAGYSIISEKLNTKYYGSVKDSDRVKNLSIARNKSLLAGNFLNNMDYILVIDVDVEFKMPAVEKILNFKKIVPDFDIVASATKRKRVLYDQWATREGPRYDPSIQELFESYKEFPYKKYYSVSSGFCLYRSEPFKNGIRYDYINKVTGEGDCEMVVVCQAFKEKGYDKIYMAHEAEMFHNHK